VFDGRDFFIVQSRPITSFTERMDMGEWTSADFRDGGVSSSVCSPFMYSLYEDAVEDSMTAYFSGIKLLRSRPKWMTYQYGRAFWNLGAVKECLKRVPGYDEEEFDKDLGIEKEYGEQGPWKTETSLATILPVIPTAIMLETEFIAHRLRISRFVRQFPDSKARILKLLGSSRECSEQAAYGLRKAITEFQGLTERTYFRAIYNSTNLQGEFKKLLDNLASEIDPKPRHLALVTGLGDIAHFECERDLHTLYTCPAEELDKEFDVFFRTHGYRGTRELDITVPRWIEDQSFIRDQVRRVRKGPDPVHPDELLGKQQKHYEEELDRVLTRLSFSSSIFFRARLYQARDYLVARERMRDCSTQAYAVVRLFALELGKRLCHRGLMTKPSQVFLLTFQEAIFWGQKPEAIKNSGLILAARQRDMDGFREFKAPHEFGIGQKPKASRADPNSLTGIPCSPGQVRALAYVAHTVEEAAKAPQGSILIAPFTDPGWTPVFSRLAAVVTEVGGLLSHAAVLSREYGIPAVLAVDGALTEFKTGEEILVDGHHGYVQRVTEEDREGEDPK
ncbi:MAG: PEP-utilizing enzyme, partial [Planctomycetota bacterium]|nr:PEP-utilizing enzyme [Planctomycetota bacterium]